MTDTSLYIEVAKAVPIVIGGILAIGGGIVGHLITHRLSETRDLKKLRRERIESLVKALYAHEDWLMEKHNALLFRNEDHHIIPSPLNEAIMLQALHFPELAAELVAVQKAQIPLLTFIGEQHIARKKDQKEWLEGWNGEPFHNAYELYILAINTVTTKCQNLLNEGKG